MQTTQSMSWKRFLDTIFFAIIGNFISAIVGLIMVFQFIYTWFNNHPNEKLLAFSAPLALYAKEIIEYLALNTETKPWPIGDYPQQ